MSVAFKKLRRPYSRFETLALAWQDVMKSLSDPYRPERHYMRGPGPKAGQARGPFARGVVTEPHSTHS